MAREVPSGVPNRAKTYVRPGKRRMLLLGATLVATVVAVGTLGLYLVGQRRIASPGPVSVGHAAFEFRCAQCHDVGKGVADLRCERCHDSPGSDRFTQNAHVLFGSSNSRKAAAAPTVACATCHTDHRGRNFHVATVDDRECGTCHKFSSLKSHPEFAAVKAKVSSGIGILFDHDRHIAEAAKTLGKKCEACHEPTADLVGFQPVNFDRHCAACHTKAGAITGDSEPVYADLLVLTPGVAGPVPPTQEAERGRITVSGMKHKDPWTVYNALRLRRMIDADGVRTEAAALRLQIAYLSQQSEAQPLAALGRPALESWRDTLRQEIAGLDQQLANPSQGGSDDAALQEISTVIRQIAKQTSNADADESAALDAQAAKGPGSASSSAGDDAQAAQAQFDARRAELVSLLQAIVDRGDSRFTDRAAALQKRVEGLKLSSDGQPDLAALRQGLAELDEILAAARATADPEAATAASDVGALRDLAQGQVNGGLSPQEFEDRRRELLGALDAIDRDNPAFAGRVTLLRQRVVALRPGTYGDEGLREERAQKAKLLARITLELDLTASGDVATPAASPAGSRDELQQRLDGAKARLASLESGTRPEVAVTPADVKKATTTLNNLLAPCAKCHVIEGAKIAPVSAAGTVFQHAVFTHKPHVEQANCLACHQSVVTSSKATDVNEPNAASCTVCHAPSKSRSDCATCHNYHPPSVARLLARF